MVLQPCHECGEQVSSQASACPICGAPVRPPIIYSNQPSVDSQLPPIQDSIAVTPAAPTKKNPVLFIVLIVAILGIVVVGIGGAVVYFKLLDGSGYRENRIEDILIVPGTLQIQPDSKNDSIFYVVGVVKNTSSETFEQVELKFILFDAQGTKLGETLDFTNKLGPSMEWHFRAVSIFTNVARVDLVEVIGR